MADKKVPRRRFITATGAVSAGVALSAGAGGLASATEQEPSAAGQRARNMSLVGFNRLDGRATYWPTIHRQQGRTIVYAGHHSGSAVNSLTGEREPNGTSVVDATDPRRPRLVHHIPGPANGSGAEHVRVCSGSRLPGGEPGREYMLRSYGKTAHQVWDVTEPESPRFLTTVVSGLRGTHKSWWDAETGIAYLVSGPPDWQSTQIMQVFDLSTPTEPRHIRDFGLPGMEPGGSGAFRKGEVTGPITLHGPIARGDRVYMAWGFAESGVVQILDRDKLLHGDPDEADPFAPTEHNLLHPQIARLDMPSFWGAHTTFPILDVDVPDFATNGLGTKRDFLLVVSEEFVDSSRRYRHLSFLADITDEEHPFPVSTLSTPEAGGDFSSVGGRFGPHASNESFTPAFYRKLVFISYFNAGVRAFDIRDPYHPVEVAHYIPDTTSDTAPSCDPATDPQVCKVAIQTNNVDVDDRGYIYIVDRMGTGMHILRLTGAAHRIASTG